MPAQIGGRQFYRRVAIVDESGHARLVSPNMALDVTAVTDPEEVSVLHGLHWKWIFRVEAVSCAVWPFVHAERSHSRP